jgi:hypothetical protein
LYGEARERSVRAVLLADVRRQHDYARLDGLIRNLDALWPDSEITGGLASSGTRDDSRVIIRRPGEEEVKVVSGAAVLLALASAVPAGAAGEALPLTHATVARNVCPVGPELRVIEAKGMCITKVALVSAGDAGQGEEGEGDEGGQGPGPYLMRALEKLESPHLVCGISSKPLANASELQVVDIAGLSSNDYNFVYVYIYM